MEIVYSNAGTCGRTVLALISMVTGSFVLQEGNLTDLILERVDYCARCVGHERGDGLGNSQPS